jgi:hypothetical protein
MAAALATVNAWKNNAPLEPVDPKMSIDADDRAATRVRQSFRRVLTIFTLVFCVFIVGVGIVTGDAGVVVGLVVLLAFTAAVAYAGYRLLLVSGRR